MSWYKISDFWKSDISDVPVHEELTVGKNGNTGPQ